MASRRIWALGSLVLIFASVAACGSGAQVDLGASEATESQTHDADPSPPSVTSESTTAAPPDCTSPAESSSVTVVPPTTGPPTTESVTTEPATTSSTAVTDPTVASRQSALIALGYWLGEADGVMGSNTAHAITAFQKAEALDRSGGFDTTTIERLATASRPLARSTSGMVMEVDLARQILMVVSDGQAAWTFDIATGASATPTPDGEYSIYREIDGFRHAPLGTLYRPKYFNGGIAFHGYTSVPAQPASHGCVRLTYPAMDFVWESDLAPLGTLVVVY